MANFANVKDEVLRKQIEEANGHMRARKPTEAVHALVDAFQSMLEKHPELLSASVPGRRGSRPLAMAWPALGANFVAGSVRDGKPQIEFTKDRFAMSEAITYYEFVVDTAVKEGM